jgi:uncharacterized protein (TIGR02453 family)
LSQISQTSFRILAELSQNNNKEWFDSNKASYQEHVRKPFATLLETLSRELAAVGMTFIGSEKTMFRVNRDVRFSNDKSPYSTHVSGVLTPSGTKSEASPLIYLHMEAEGGFAVAGLYRPPTDRVDSIRENVLERSDDFSEVLESLAKSGLELDTSEATVQMPRAFKDQADHPHAQALKLKNMMVRIDISQPDWLDSELISRLVAFASSSKPLLDFLSKTAAS